MKHKWMLIIILPTLSVVFCLIIVKYMSDHEDLELQLLGKSQAVLGGARAAPLAGATPAAHKSYVYNIGAVLSTKKSSKVFVCFGAMFSLKWFITAAHCRTNNSTHLVILYSDVAKNVSKTYVIQVWLIHNEYRRRLVVNNDHKNDIALAKLNRSCRDAIDDTAMLINNKLTDVVEASIWKSVFRDTERATNEVDNYLFKIINSDVCSVHYGTVMDDSVVCVDVTACNTCFDNDFGPIFYENKLLGILAAQPLDCFSKFAIFTNISYYAKWIYKWSQFKTKVELDYNF